jgi:hypothetical protein
VSGDLRRDGTEAGSLSPPRRYSWPAFTAGNQAHMTHGARSRDGHGTWAPIAEALASEVVETCPWLDRRAHAAAVQAWARTEARLALVAAWLAEHGDLDEHGSPRPATNLAGQLERRAQALRAELGLSPMSLSLLMQRLAEATKTALPLLADGRDLDGLDELADEGRAILERAAGRLPGETSSAELRERAGQESPHRALDRPQSASESASAGAPADDPPGRSIRPARLDDPDGGRRGD